jgi:methyl-accepting chemotaxis protein
MEDAGKIAARSRAQAVIEFNMDGTIRNANPNFLNAMGYALSDNQGRHHSMFVEADERNSHAYRGIRPTPPHRRWRARRRSGQEA